MRRRLILFDLDGTLLCPTEGAEGAVAVPGLGKVLIELRRMGFKLGLVSNGGRERQRAKLESLGITDHLDVILISGSVGVRKPEPRIFAMALNKAGSAAAEAWFVGNDPSEDIEGATRAGLSTVWVSNGHPWPAGLVPPRLVIGELLELPGALATDGMLSV